MGITVGMIGLGQIGMPVARLLLEAGHTVYGYRRHAMDDLEALGGIPARSPAEIGDRCAVALICVPSDEALLDLVAGEAGLARGARPGFVAADLSMLTLAAKREARAMLQASGADLLDAPVSGIPPMEAAKRASYFVSGAQDAYERAKPAFATLGEQHYYLGEFGCGSAMKAVANLLVAVHALAAAEALVLAEKAGLNAQTVIDLIKPSIAGSATFAARAPTMAAHAFEQPNGAFYRPTALWSRPCSSSCKRRRRSRAATAKVERYRLGSAWQQYTQSQQKLAWLDSGCQQL